MAGSRLHRPKLAWMTGLLAGALAGAAVTGTAVAHRLVESTGAASLEVSHLPPLLTAEDETVELRYDAYCITDDDPEAPCDVEGTVFARTGDRGRFRELELREDRGTSEGRYVAVLPAAIARSPDGFSYYAVLTSERAAARVTLPAAGSSAPQRSYRLERSVEAVLGTHAFGGTRRAGSRPVEAAWGTGPNEVGLEQGRSLTPIGGSSFDVGRDGSIHLLDEANGRVLRWAPSTPVPVAVPVAINGTLADLSVAEDGTMYVLETTAETGRSTLLRVFGRDGSAAGAIEMGEHAAQVRLDAAGSPVVLQHPSGQWMAAASDGGLLGPAGQRTTGRPGRSLREGGEIVVLRRGDELRLALVGPSGVRRSWRVTSETPLAEVQLAEPLGAHLVVVVRAYSHSHDEFVVLVLDDRGLVAKFSLDSTDWAETAPLSRFRLAGSSLYRLGSTPAGVFVDRFDLEVQ